MTEVEKVEQTTEEKPFNQEAFIKGEQAPEVETTTETTETTTETTETKPKTETTKTTITTPTKVELDDYWTQHVENMGEGYEIPEFIKTGKNEKGETLTRKEKFELIQQEIYKHTDTGDDDFTLEYKQKKAELKDQFDRDQFLKSKTQQQELAKMSDDDFLFAVNKAQFGKTDNNPDGLDDDAIREDIEKMSKLDKREKRTNIQRAYDDLQKQRTEEHKATLKTKFDESVKETDNKNTLLVTNYLKKIEGKNSIDGIEFSEADLVQFKKEVPEMFKVKTVKDKDGNEHATTEAQELLNDVFADEEKSMTFTSILYMIKHNKLLGYTSSIKEKTKEQIEKKLDPNLDEPPGSDIGGPTEFSAKKFIQGTTQTQ